jgi:hypothetical protein
MLIAGHANVSHAQNNNNILGLPAVPQAPQAAASGTPSAKPGTVPVAPSDAEIKAAISGSIKLASFYQEGLVIVRVETVKTYIGGVQRAQALQAARLVQRDVRLSCGKLCKPAPMPSPTLLANNTLSFDMVISGYSGTISTADMVNLVSAKPISPGGKPAPVAATPVLPVTATPTSAAADTRPAPP